MSGNISRGSRFFSIMVFLILASVLVSVFIRRYEPSSSDESESIDPINDIITPSSGEEIITYNGTFDELISNVFFERKKLLLSHLLEKNITLSNSDNLIDAIINVFGLNYFHSKPRAFPTSEPYRLLHFTMPIKEYIEFDPFNKTEMNHFENLIEIYQNNDNLQNMSVKELVYFVSWNFYSPSYIDDYLREGYYYDPSFFKTYVVPLSHSIADNASSDIEKVTRIINYVRDNVEYVSYTASTFNVTFLEKKGNCMGYSGMIVALCRAVGIPARIVGAENMYNRVGHAWVEAYVDGKWIAFGSTGHYDLDKDGLFDFDIILNGGVTGVTSSNLYDYYDIEVLTYNGNHYIYFDYCYYTDVTLAYDYDYLNEIINDYGYSSELMDAWKLTEDITSRIEIGEEILCQYLNVNATMIPFFNLINKDLYARARAGVYPSTGFLRLNKQMYNNTVITYYVAKSVYYYWTFSVKGNINAKYMVNLLNILNNYRSPDIFFIFNTRSENGDINNAVLSFNEFNLFFKYLDDIKNEGTKILDNFNTALKTTNNTFEYNLPEDILGVNYTIETVGSISNHPDAIGPIVDDGYDVEFWISIDNFFELNNKKIRYQFKIQTGEKGLSARVRQYTSVTIIEDDNVSISPPYLECPAIALNLRKLIIINDNNAITIKLIP